MEISEMKKISASINNSYGVLLEESASKLTQGGWGTWGEGTGKFHNGK